MEALPGWVWLAAGLGLVLLALLATLKKKKASAVFDAPLDGSSVSVGLHLEKGGEVAIELFSDVAPNHVASFLKLAADGYYNGLIFHRVVPGFVVQAGCPKGDGTGGPRYTLAAEFNDRPHLSGTVAMARTSDPDSAGSQFYICLAPQPSLDRQYTVFGQVIHGFEYVQAIEKGDIIKEIRINS
jgi:peptidylprolyl isomerase/peptidyl-prolyl cis-trans isomerase B (cyclophilin B)